MGTALDTVIAHYFLLSDEFELLLRLLDPPVVVPSIVFDPDEKGSAAAAQSELRRAIAYEQRRAKDVTSDEDDRKLASANVRRLEAVIGYVRRGQLQVVDMTSDEYDLYNELTTAELENLYRMLEINKLLNSEHNLKKLLDAGLCVTLNSDDPAYFGGYVLENYLASAKALGLGRAELARLCVNSISASLLPPERKAALLRKIG
jgi:hypothetical protein